MFGNKKLLKRIKSLEDHLGAMYDENDDYTTHCNSDHGFMARISRMKEQFDKKVLKLKDSDY